MTESTETATETATAQGEPEQPLAGLRVVELATGVAGPWASKLLADYGADVVKVEPPGGDPARREGATTGPRPDPEAAPLFLHLNTNKRSVVADLDRSGGVDLVRRLVARADVLIESERPGRLAALGLGVDELRVANPRLVVTSVTPFGQTGPLGEAGHDGGDLVAYAMGGPMHATGDPAREPMKLAGRIVEYQSGSVAALGTLAAVMMAEASGRGTHVDVANYETQASSIDRRAALAVGHQYDGQVGTRVGGGRLGVIPAGVYPTADGYCQIVFAPNWMPRLADLLDDEELRRRFADPAWIDDEELPELVNAALFGWTLARTKQEAMVEAQAWGLAVMPVNDTVEVLADPHFRQRGFWHRWHHPVVGEHEAPGPPFRMAGGWSARRPAPTLDQHRGEVLTELDRPAETVIPPAPTGARRRLPLEGVRVLDLTVVWAGPLCATLLADLGAEVIRLDNPNLFPTATRGAIPRPPPGREADLGQFWGRFPGGEGGERPWNRVAAFVCHARNKLGATIDLRTDLGKETFLQLVDRADLIVENNSVKVLPSLGLGWEALSARNPRLIGLRMPSLGLDGPYAGYVGFGAHLEALCGLSSLRGYRDLDPTSLDSTYFMDPASGVVAAFAALCALRRRGRRPDGVGELVEFAQAENLLNYIGEYLVDAALTGAPHECHGNRHPHRAPQGAYRCGPDTGDQTTDRWMVLSVPDDRCWARLVREMGSPTWACDPELATEAGRRAAHDRLDAHLADWAASLDVDEAVARCRRAGAAAGPVLDEAGLFADPHLRARGFFRLNGSSDVPTIELAGHQWRWDGPPLRWSELNVMGRDNDRVYREVLGLDDEAMAALEADGHLADGYRTPTGESL